MSKPTSLERLRAQHEQACRQLAKLQSKRYAGDELVEFFHMGLPGGSGKAARKLNKRKERDLDRVIDDAKAMNKLRQHIASLERRIKSFHNQPPKPKAAKRNKRKSKPTTPAPVISESYNQWAKGLWNDMEDRISRCRSRFVTGAWDNLHNQSLRGEMAVYIDVQAHINAEHLREKQVTMEGLKADLLKEQAKVERKMTAELDKAWLQAHGTAFIATTILVLALLDQQTVSV